ncbi:TetR/AcrR family transcriptional regulator [Mycobacterium sp. M26]|uniref:TetR/AcrR family transcriptional regulator n=1 Tax=Mycobacterium sp. M26 TaxID=1762962 RepID=UPI00073F9E23|nr:TetR/AcrR family transcriptional regulator [Mycobacterium sp. M26]
MTPRTATPDSLAGDRRTASKGERQRRAILDTLARLVADRPIGELTVGEITAEAGVTRSGFYFYFDSKYSALAVITTEIWSELMDRAESFVRFDRETPAEFLDRCATIVVGVWHAHAAVLIASIQAIPLDDQIASLWREWNARLSQILARQVRKDQDAGIAKPASADVEGLVFSLHEMTQHMFYLDRLGDCDAEQTRRTTDALGAIWLRSVWGITPDEAR